MDNVLEPQNGELNYILAYFHVKPLKKVMGLSHWALPYMATLFMGRYSKIDSVVCSHYIYLSLITSLSQFSYFWYSWIWVCFPLALHLILPSLLSFLLKGIISGCKLLSWQETVALGIRYRQNCHSLQTYKPCVTLEDHHRWS